MVDEHENKPGWYYLSEDSPVEDYWDGETWAGTPRPRAEQDAKEQPTAYPPPDDATIDGTDGLEPTTSEPDGEPATNRSAETVGGTSQKSGRLAAAIISGLVGVAVGYMVHQRTGPTSTSVAADQFCALGDGTGSNLLDVGGWIKAAQRTTDDWEAVLEAIDDQCPAWRTQVSLRASELGN